MAYLYNVPQQATISVGTGNAQTDVGNGTYVGQRHRQDGGSAQLYRCNDWTWNGSSWDCQPLAKMMGTSDPISTNGLGGSGSVTPDAIRQEFFNSTNGFSYVATGLTNNDWTRVV